MTALVLLLGIDFAAAEREALRCQLSRFPPAAVCEARAAFASAHLDHLEARLSLGQGWRRNGLCERVAGTKRRRNAWLTLAAAHYWRDHLTGGPADGLWDGLGGACGHDVSPAEMCALRLRELRGLIGESAYGFGEMPPPADFAYFSRAD